MPAFLLRAALQARRTINGWGLLIRAVCAVVMFLVVVAGPPSPWPGLALILPMMLGVSLAVVEWHEGIIDRATQSGRRWLRPIGRYLTSTRDRATVSVTALLEIPIGPICAAVILASPWAPAMDPTARAIGIAALALFVADALVQVVEDAGYYNYLPGSKPPSWTIAVRDTLPILAFSVLVLLQLTVPSGRPSLSVAIGLSSVALVAFPVRATAAAVYNASLRAHSHSVGVALAEARSRAAGDAHRLKSTVFAEGTISELRMTRAMTGVDGDPPLVTREWALEQARRELLRAIEEIWLQTELMRVQSAEPLSELTLHNAVINIQEGLARRGHGSTDFDIECGTDVVLDPVAANLTRSVIFDLVDNSFRSQTPPPSIKVLVDSEAVATGRRWRVLVQDDGPGFVVTEKFPRSSSTQSLARRCESASGRLIIDSGPHGTSACATFVAEDLGTSNHRGQNGVT